MHRYSKSSVIQYINSRVNHDDNTGNLGAKWAKLHENANPNADQLNTYGGFMLNLMDNHFEYLGILLLFHLIFPGYVFLKLMKLNKINKIDFAIYLTSVSFFVLIIVVFIINYLYPVLGYHKPISKISLFGTIFAFNMVLFIVCYRLRKLSIFKNYFHSNLNISFNKLSILTYLSILTLPIFSIIGTFYQNNYHNNSIMVLSYVAISFTIIYAIILNKSGLYPIAILSISLSLLLNWSLITAFIPISDNTYEYFYSNLVISNGVYNTSISESTNSLLSVVILNPIFYHFLGIDLTKIYKLILPLIMILVPLGIYSLHNRHWTREISFLSSIFFMSIFTFFSWIAQSSKHTIGYLFLIAFLLAVNDNNLDKKQRAILSIVFILSLIVSIYAISYLLLVILLGFIFISFVIRFLKIYPNIELCISNNLLGIYIISILLWYMYASNGITFDFLTTLGMDIFNQILEFSLESTPGFKYVSDGIQPVSLLLRKYFFYLIVLLEGIGISYCIYNIYKNKKTFYFELILATESYVFLFTFFLPLFTVSFSSDRLFNFSSIFLAPYLINILVISSKKLLNSLYPFKGNSRLPIVAASIFVVIFLLFESGIMSCVIFKDAYFSSALSGNNILINGTSLDINKYYSDYMSEFDVVGAEWLSDRKNVNFKICSDYLSVYPLYSYGNSTLLSWKIYNLSDIFVLNPHDYRFEFDRPYYVFLRNSNIYNGEMVYDLTMISYNISILSPNLHKLNFIYNNGGCNIWGSARPVR